MSEGTSPLSSWIGCTSAMRSVTAPRSKPASFCRPRYARKANRLTIIRLVKMTTQVGMND
jgi:hypothetical protein